MKLSLVLFTISLLPFTLVHSAELTPELQRRQIVHEIQRLAEINAPLSKMQFQTLCTEVDGKSWCAGYIAALLTIHQIPKDCLPRTDMAPFRYGGVWEYTNTWLSKQPQDSSFTFYKAITLALADDDRCPIGERIHFDAPGYTPYSDAEWLAMRLSQEPTLLTVVEPTYPSEARNQGIEGWVQVSFTITESGDVKDVFLIDSEPPEIFDQVSIEAAAQFTFEPYVTRGTIREVPNFQHVFRFNLDTN
jgi:TonB family protein